MPLIIFNRYYKLIDFSHFLGAIVDVRRIRDCIVCTFKPSRSDLIWH
jgi:hypothetical protein